MPISGLLLTLSPDEDVQRRTVVQLKTRPELLLGTVVDHWLPVALDAKDDEQSRELHDWLIALPGVEYVDVVCVNFEEPPQAQEFLSSAAHAEPQPL